MLPIVPALALQAERPQIILPQRHEIVVPTEEERQSFDPALGILPFPTPLLTVAQSGGGGGGGGVFIVGNNAAQTTNTANAGDVQQGIIAQAASSGTANNIVIQGSSASNTSGTFRLTVYAASSSTVIAGALLGRSSDQSGAIVANVANSYPLQAPVSIVAGNWYALMLHGGTISGGTGSNSTLGDKWFSDTYSDGPLATAPNGGVNSPNGHMIWLTT